MQKLCEMKTGKSGHIADVKGDKRFLSRITSVGLTRLLGIVAGSKNIGERRGCGCQGARIASCGKAAPISLR